MDYMISESEFLLKNKGQRHDPSSGNVPRLLEGSKGGKRCSERITYAFVSISAHDSGCGT